MGVGTLSTNTIGSDNTAVGFNALNVSTVDELTAVGSGALFSNTTGLRNTAVGFQALTAEVSATDCTAVGHRALLSNTGNTNTAVGSGAMASNTIGGVNTAVGAGALGANDTFSQCAAFGFFALAASVANSNTAFGSQSLTSVTTGGENTGVGTICGVTLTTGARNTLLGSGTNVSAAAAAGRIAIGINAAGVAANALLDDGLYYPLTLLLAPPGNPVLFDAATGQMGPTVSSRRFKKDISALTIDTARIFDLRPVEYTLKTHNIRDFGYVAEEVAEILPCIVPRDAEGLPFGVSYDKLTVMLVEELRKVRAEVAALKKKIG
jgi:hypothetical protein